MRAIENEKRKRHCFAVFPSKDEASLPSAQEMFTTCEQWHFDANTALTEMHLV